MTPTIRTLTERDIPHAAVVVALAFTDDAGRIPERYLPLAIIDRLQWSLDAAGNPGAPRYLVAEVDGAVVAIGGYARSRFGGDTWELLLGATMPRFQGRGIGHALMLERWEAIRAEAPEGGLVVVSTKNVARFQRYGFSLGPMNRATGASLMWASVPAGGRAAA